MSRLMKNAVVWAALLGLFCAGFASAAAGASKEKSKSYEITVGTATKVGGVVLTPGEYKFKLDGANAVFTKQGTGKSFTTPGKLEEGKEEFDKTMVHQIKDEGQNRIISIELKGTQSVLKFE